MPRLSIWMVRTALIHLGIGFTIGALMLANKGIVFYPALWRLRDIHIEVLVFGWMLQFAMGVAYWALPRFPGQHRYGRAPLGWASYGLLNISIVTICGALWLRQPVIIFAGWIILLAAAVAFAILMWPRIKPLGGYPPKRV